MNHLTIEPGERAVDAFTADVAAFMMVEGTASGLICFAIIDDTKVRELGYGYNRPPFAPNAFGIGVPVRPGLPFYVAFDNHGDAPVSVSYRVYADHRDAAARGASVGCAPGCLLAALGVALAVSMGGVLSACDWNYSKVCIEERCTPGMDYRDQNGVFWPGPPACSCLRYKITRTGPDGGVAMSYEAAR